MAKVGTGHWPKQVSWPCFYRRFQLLFLLYFLSFFLFVLFAWLFPFWSLQLTTRQPFLPPCSKLTFHMQKSRNGQLTLSYRRKLTLRTTLSTSCYSAPCRSLITQQSITTHDLDCCKHPRHESPAIESASPSPHAEAGHSLSRCSFTVFSHLTISAGLQLLLNMSPPR